MVLTPFTIEEAEEIREDFEDLIDTEFKAGSSPLLLIDDVIISPLNDTDKNKLATQYFDTKDKTFATFYTGDEYDVVLMTSLADDETERSFIDIRSFATLRGIKYSFP